MVFAVFALLGVLVWFTRRQGLGSFTPRRGKIRCLELLERVQLTPHHAIHLIRVSEKVLLIATAPSTCVALGEPASSGLPMEVRQDLLSNKG